MNTNWLKKANLTFLFFAVIIFTLKQTCREDRAVYPLRASHSSAGYLFDIKLETILFWGKDNLIRWTVGNKGSFLEVLRTINQQLPPLGEYMHEN